MVLNHAHKFTFMNQSGKISSRCSCETKQLVWPYDGGMAHCEYDCSLVQQEVFSPILKGVKKLVNFKFLCLCILGPYDETC